MRGASQNDVRPTARMGRTRAYGGLLALLDDVVVAVVADLEDREPDSAHDIAELVEGDRLAEDRHRHLDLADVDPDLGAAHLPVGARHRNALGDRLHSDEGRGSEGVRLT